MPDFEIRNEGTVFTVTPLTLAGREWLDANVESEGWQWLGRSLVVDHRYAGGLVEAILESGLEVA